MSFLDYFIIVLLTAVFNIVVYAVFKKYLYGRADAGMKFLIINISKDIIWLIVSLMIIEKTKADFLFMSVCFIVASVLIYLPVIRLMNKL